MAQYDGSIRIGTEITTKQAEKELKSLESSISKTADKIASLRSKMDALKDVKLPTDEYKAIQNQIDTTEKKINDLLARQEKFLATGGKESSSTYQKMQYDVEELKNSLPFLKGELQDLIDTGKAFTLGSDTEEYTQMSAQMQQLNQQMQSDTQRQSELQSTLAAEEERLAQIKANATVSDQQVLNLLERRKQLVAEIKDMEAAGVGLGYKQYEDANRELEEINEKIKNYRKSLDSVPEKFEKMRKSANKAFAAASNGAKKSSGFLSTFASRLKGLALSLLIFNWISKAFNAMISGMKQGFTNFMNYSDSFANSVQGMKNAMATLGNQFAAAFAPIVQVVIPWLSSLVSALSTAMSYVAQFIAVLGGKSTFTRAKQVQDSYNKSLGNTAKAADKARGALAKFDDLDVLEKKQKDSGGGGGGGVEDAAGDLFEEIPVDPAVTEWLNGILDKLKPILDYVGELKKAFMEGFWDGLGDWEYRWDIIKKGLEQIKNALIDIWTDPAVLAAADAWLKSLMYMFGSLVGSIASIALTIAAAFIGGLGEYMENNVDRIKAFLISAFNIGTEINYLLADLFQSIAYIFEAFASESGIRFMAALIGSVADASMGMIELALKLGRDILEMIILPITENKEGFKTALEGLLSAGATVLEGLKESIDSIFDNMNAVYDAHLKPFFDSVANGLSRLVETFLNVWNGSVQPIIDRIAERISELLTAYITPFINSVVEFIGNLATVLQTFWETFLMPLVEWIITYAVPIISDIIGIFVELIISIVEIIIGLFTGLMDFLNGTVIPAWQSLWESAGDVFDAFFGVLDSIGKMIKNTFDGLFKTIKLLIDGDWKGAWENAKKIFTNFKDDVIGVVESIKEFFGRFFDWISEKIKWVLDKLSGIAKAFVSSPGGNPAFSQGGSGRARSAVGYPSSAYASYSSVLQDIPHLASGSVIRGGNPFMAILGDQPRGHVNVEAPLSTIEQAVENVMNRRGYNNMPAGGFNPTISLNVDGQEFARLTLSDILQEASRQGYDVSVLGVT